MELSIQTALLNVTDLQRSIDFYKDVFDLGLISRGDEVAALMILEANRRQVLLLRELRGSVNNHPAISDRRRPSRAAIPRAST